MTRRSRKPTTTDLPTGDDIDPDLVEAWARACNGVYLVLKRGRGTVGRGGGGRTLTEAQVAVLESVAQEGALPVGTIARRAGIAQPTATRMLNTLESQGIVRRRPSPRDVRVALVELTDEGVELWAEKHAVLMDYQRDALSRFEPERRQQVVAMLQELVDIIEDQIS
ncbi:MarR family winged helix-turn-helix transcriptional regulator [Enemella evansiae]|uniref:MarR family winged helix-turn-helix transcriptional regulator n=1 Tax=Enemella evansiae TaxID=2016499 RepID=UPI0015C5BA8F|nr:MarR family transcriptional regulator [Enemella evansiae]